MGAKFDPSDNDGINDINITPFVDVVLVLLVIFMVTAPMMIKESLNIKLPKSESSDASEPYRLGIALNRQGQVLLNGELISFEALALEAAIALTNNEKVQALISADEEARHGDVIKVLDIIKKAGIENFAFQIERQSN
jgi:biopolymer transport protein ExbD